MSFSEHYGPWAVIAGGSEGIGASFAMRLGAAGINLVLLARKLGPLEETASAVRAAHGVEVRTLAVDLTADDIIQRVRAVTDGLDVGMLVYNAGLGNTPVLLTDQRVEEALAVIKVNPIGQTRFAAHFGAAMRARGRGAIVFIGSLGCAAGCAGLAVYSAAKAFTLTLGEGLWAEMQPAGVDVLTVVAGRTRTPALERNPDYAADAASAADPEDVVSLALDNLKNGPVALAPGDVEAFEGLRAMPRGKAAKIMSRSVLPQG